jgi:hypothetical protein
MNADYKLLTRIIANRLGSLVTDLLQPSQHCGVPGNTILEAVEAVREAIAQATVTKAPLFILSLDFQAAFENISHTYLFAILQGNGFSERFIHRIRNLYGKAKSSIQINGHISTPFPVRCSAGKGCPLSMQLFALCLNPLLRTLVDKLPVIRIGRRGDKTSVVAYADDVTIFLTSPVDIPIIQDVIRCYETASGARVNIRKSKAMAIGIRGTNTNIMNIPYYTYLLTYSMEQSPS